MTLTLLDIARARAYISRPDMCTVPGLIEWVSALADAWEGAEVADDDGPSAILLGSFSLDDYAGTVELYRCAPCGALLPSSGVDAHQTWHERDGR